MKGRHIKKMHESDQIVATHHSDIALDGWSTCKVSCPVRICTICISEIKCASTLRKNQGKGIIRD